MRLDHYYHVYCDGAKSVPIVLEHIAALKETGLFDRLDFFGGALIGTEENREILKSTLETVGFQVLAEDTEGWEHHTLREMKFSEPSAVFYAHTKGSAFPSVLQDRWRISMLNCVVYDWQRCVEAVTNEGLAAIGAFWRPRPWNHYAGTFWWANSDYLQTLPPFIYDSRWEAEAWIGKGVGLFGDIGPGHPATDKIERGWSYREGTVKVDSRMFGLSPKKIYHDIEVTRLMQSVSDSGRHLTVIESHPAVKTIKITQKDYRTGPPPGIT